MTVEDSVTTAAMKLVWQRMKIIVELSAAVALAVIIDNGVAFRGKKVGVILSGGNVDFDKLPF
jgi:threonine dehydratase